MQVDAALDVLLDPIVPVFAIAAFGFGMGLSGRVQLSDARAVNRAVMGVFLPILLFGLIADARIDAFNPVLIAFYCAAEAALWATGFALARYVFGLSAGESFLLGFSTIFVNSVLFVLPISARIYGDQATLPIASIAFLDSTLTFALAIIFTQAMASKNGGDGVGRALREMVKNPMLIAMALGLAVNLSGLKTPAPLATFVDFNGAAAAPLALFALGVVMSQNRFRLDAVSLSFCTLKIVAFPALVAMILLQVAPGDASTPMFLFVAAGPSGTMAFTLALLHDIRADRIGQVIVITSVVTLLSMAALA